MSNYVVTDTQLTNIANAIRTKGGTSAQLEFPSDFVSAIGNIDTGTFVPPEGKVIFIDYDGTILHEYIPTQFAALSALPQNPTHTGLTSQGWNYTLEEAKEYMTAYPSAYLTIGQMYVTSDGKTKIYVSIGETKKSALDFALYIVGSNFTIDWGDGSALDGWVSGSTTYPHTYASAGDYVISISGGSISFSGTSVGASSGYAIWYGTGLNHLYRALAIKKIELGSNILNNGIGQRAFQYCHNLETITIPSHIISYLSYAFYLCQSLKSITLAKNSSLQYFADDLFAGCRALKYASLPKITNSSQNNRTIGEYMFSSCASLKYIAIPDRTQLIKSSAFANCYNLEKATIPNSVTEISNYAFNYCYNLKYVKIPNSVTFIATAAFQYCYNLDNVEIPSGCQWLTEAFSYCYSLKSVKLPSTLSSSTASPSYSFRVCISLENITIPDNVTNIGASMFADCSSLKEITIPNNVTSVDQYAFSNCSSLRNVTFSTSLTTIGKCAFYNCNSLKNFTIPSTVTTIGDSAFYGCVSLTEATIPSSVTSIGQNLFYGCTYLKKVEINAPITYINQTMFYSCASLNEITFPSTITSISKQAFQGCTSLFEITIPENVTTIGVSAFNGCNKLQSVTLPSTLTSIGNTCFASCTYLKECFFKGTTPPTLGTTPIPTNSGLVIYVPYSADHSVLNAYTTNASWSSYTSYLQEYDYDGTAGA